ncbi:MAG: DNA replication/repair protein RecF [Bacillota bacterium]
MRLQTIFLKNFRNYSFVDFSPSLGLNFLLGNNAQGKTSFIEACAYLCLGRSIRGISDQHILKFDQDYFTLEGIFIGNSLQQKTTIKYLYMNSSKEKKILINDLPVNRLIEALGLQKAVFFLAEHLNLVKGPPNLRRNYLDVLIMQINPKYYQDTLEYKKIIQHRNHTLRYGRNSKSLNLQLQIWDEQLIELAGKIIFKRIEVIKFLRENLPKIHGNLTHCEETLSIRYQSPMVFDFTKDFSLQEIIQALQVSFDKNRNKDIQYGITTIGPHRDDIFFELNGKDAKIFASQGQQRTIALSLKIAEVDLFFNKLGEEPLVLLDDVFSELDQFRQKQLLQFVKHGQFQCFITATSLGMIDKDWIEEATVISVEKGTLIK